MKLLSGLFIVLCLIVLVSAEGHQRRRQNFKVFKQRRLNPDNLGRRGNYRDTFKQETVFAPTTKITPTTTVSPGPGTPSTSTPSTSTPSTSTSYTTPSTTPSTTSTPSKSKVTLFNKNKSNEDHLDYDQLVNRFDQEDLDDMIELLRLRRRKNRRQSGVRRHRQ